MSIYDTITIANKSPELKSTNLCSVSNKRLDAALTYTKDFNWYVFPVPPGTKASYKSQEQYGTPWGQTNNPHDVHRDWSRYPDANIGLPCGKQNGFFVVDVDTNDGHSSNGFSSLSELEIKYGILPDTLQAISPSGSILYYFNYPNNIMVRNSTSKIGPGIDIRGDGGMVIAPPSVKGDKIYRWHNVVPIVDAPQWLIDLITIEDEAHSPSSKKDTANQRQPADLDKVLRALITISPDCNYDTWFKVLCALDHEFGDIGFHLAAKWSKGSSSKYNASAFSRQWKSIKSHQSKHPITIGTLFHLARGAQ